MAIVACLAYVVAFELDEPVRRYTEEKMNAALKGYTVRIEQAHFHPFNFALNLKGLTVRQDGHPDPPVMHVPFFHASVHWRALLHGRVVGDLLISRPKIYLNLAQMRQEIADPIPLKERGWQKAIEAVYPLKINVLRIRDGDVTYEDRGPFKPLRIRNLSFTASNIRNVQSKADVYPSDFQADATVFDMGRVRIDGQADFLAEPNPTFIGNAQLERIELDYFKPIASRYNVSVAKGLLSATGQVEFGSKARRVELREATITGTTVEYVHTGPTAAVEQARVTTVVEAAQRAGNAPDLLVKIARLHITKSSFAYVNRTTNPPYRVFLADTDVTVSNLSNQTTEGVGTASVKGKFMDSGNIQMDVRSRAAGSGPAFDVSVRITDVNLEAMNDLFRAYGKFDVASGQFAFYSELAIAHGQISGYVKPLFKDITVYAAPTEDRSLTHRLYVKVVGAVAKILKNRPRREVATRADISGRVDDPKVSALQVAVRLVENAFFKAILPGLEKETERARG
ncbi:MAG TPA: DUF748 domain-containing protein [Candidatus Methylomirabilis sp.]|nr:DUF748 domain-containing protein [Candidatus Methylomirabilis sp.]